MRHSIVRVRTALEVSAMKRLGTGAKIDGAGGIRQAVNGSFSKNTRTMDRMIHRDGNGDGLSWF
ncbi:MAG TPA: hypothetical protein DG084_00540 [Gemmatimonadetes bacterium]|nr:hypothetical protein [Gemmatimonadota bacterium]